ncbi:MAG: hypothetical protein HY579_06745 [Nitrospinae bacterium]|nr:hypothetical protein [Nitrospinota bacterium]
MDSVFLLSGGFVLGCLHALDTDHIATVSALIVEKQPLRKTLGLALRWSLGHSLTLLALAGLMVSAKGALGVWSFSGAERLVGLSMIGLGSWVLSREWKRMATPGGHEEERHGRSGLALFGMGVLHGVAGSSSIFLLVPVAVSGSGGALLAYVLLFSAGMILTMGLYSALVNKGLVRFFRYRKQLRYVSILVVLAVGFRLLAGLQLL